MLDVNALASTLPPPQQQMCATPEVVPSPSGTRLAYTLDTSGYETYSVWLRVLTGGGGSGGRGGGGGGERSDTAGALLTARGYAKGGASAATLAATAEAPPFA